MNFDELQEIAKIDMKIDETDLTTESLKIPELQHKYLNYYSNFNLLLKQSEIKYKNLYLTKWEHYVGKEDKPHPKKILRQDASIYIDADDDLNKIKVSVEYYKTIILYLDGILKSLNNRGFQIKNALDNKKYFEGLT